MTADKTGSLSGVRRRDYLPFGEELAAGTGGRTAQQGYSADNVRQQFTAYERDAETGLDFAEARYYSRGQGRFTAVDPLHSSAQPTDPQSFNRYAYVSNNPLAFTDPSGMSKGPAGFAAPQIVNGNDGNSRWVDDFNSSLPDVSAEPVAGVVTAGGPGQAADATLGQAQASADANMEQTNQSVGAVGPQKTDDERAAETVAAGVRAALEILKIGCFRPDGTNQDVQPGNRYFANVQNADKYAQGWSGSSSVHASNVKESPIVADYGGRWVTDRFSGEQTTYMKEWSFVVKYYPGQGMAVTSETWSLPHAATVPGYVTGLDKNINVRWANQFLSVAPKCK